MTQLIASLIRYREPGATITVRANVEVGEIGEITSSSRGAMLHLSVENPNRVGA
jgi:hypothetical protein